VTVLGGNGTTTPVGTPSESPQAEIEHEILPRPVVASESAARAWTQYLLGIGLVGLVTYLLLGNPYWLNLFTVGLLFAGIASAWNIIGGFGGQFSLGHSVFFGIGAYTVVLLQVNHGWSPWLALAAGSAIASAVAVVLAWPLFRLRGPFFAIGTLALSQVAAALANYFEFTGGPGGLRIPYQDLAVTDPKQWAWIMFAYVAVTVAVVVLIVRNRLGYYLVAVRDEEDAAAAAGANPLLVKTIGLVISAALTAVGGGLLIMFIGFLDPAYVLSIIDVGARMPLLVLIGGIGTVAGPVIGALILHPGEAYFRGEFATLPPGVSQLAIGVILVLAALTFKRGIWGTLIHVVGRLRGRH
jgi:branched-chain amino acid transport system permease protein